MKAMVAKAVRQILFVAGGAIGAKSTASDSDVELVTGAVMVIGSLAWSWWKECRERKEAARVGAVVGLCAMCFGLVGCSTVAPGSDPVVVRAEQATIMAIDTIDAFLKFERANEALLGKDVHGVAQLLRREAPRAILAARLATKTYKGNRSAENKATLNTALAVLTALAAQASASLQAQTACLMAPLAQAAVPAGVVLAINAVMALLAWIAKERETLRRTGELTPEEDAALDAELDAKFKSDAWRE